ncbi:non-heme iron oxygenase ferredoxin subunit [Streptomyces sp. WELS2]|uniref:non-heme iron oxygenase ferredoxin subunit n=1 Tax=Streptomyces sp. WELS2 TaxID=2749435 RepID=UPI0015F0D154|nr:non-heme iron oxygenase ferredoxin subunit [Streptomyces sp. WELS2]
MQSEAAERRIPLFADGDLEDGDAFLLPADAFGGADSIAVFKDEGQYHALDDTCPHANASLSEGWVEDGEVECPLHGGRFCLRTGEATAMPATGTARTYPVEVRDGRVWLVLDGSE